MKISWRSLFFADCEWWRKRCWGRKCEIWSADAVLNGLAGVGHKGAVAAAAHSNRPLALSALRPRHRITPLSLLYIDVGGTRSPSAYIICIFAISILWLTRAHVQPQCYLTFNVMEINIKCEIKKYWFNSHDRAIEMFTFLIMQIQRL